MLRRRGSWAVAVGLLATALGSVYGCELVAGLHKPKPAHCSNGILDEGEGDVDCGGECPVCDNKTCSTDEECASLHCGGNMLCTPADCTRMETPCWACHSCGVDKACASNADCQSGLCDQGTCHACTNDNQCPSGKCGPAGMPRAGECLDVTCHYDGGTCGDGGTGGHGGAGGSGTGGHGGSGTGGHGGAGGSGTGGHGGMGGSSTSSTASSSGTGGTGGGSTCSDHIQDGDETDVDCGGSCPTKCAAMQTCGTALDCASGVCFQSKCQLPCMDGSKDGDETDVDCGGSCPVKCGTGKHCLGNADCLFGVCDNSHTCN